MTTQNFTLNDDWLLRGVLATTVMILTSHASAESLTVSGNRMSRYWCDKLGGSAQGESTCSVNYLPYPGNACMVYEASERERPSPFVPQAMERAKGCNPSAITKLKEDTVLMRVDLMSGVKLGSDETRNDPLRSPDKEWINRLVRIEQVAQSYFGWECAISRCSRGAASANRLGSEDGGSMQTKEGGQASKQRRPTGQGRPTGSQGGGDGATQKEATLQVCNAGSIAIEAAVVFLSKQVPVSAAKSMGELWAWYVIRPGECQNLANNRWTSNSTSAPNWLHARAAGRAIWPSVADISFCLPNSLINGRLVDIVKGDLSCAPGESLERFGRINVTPPSHVLTLRPGG
jgi:hypothetical protein